MKEMLKMMAVLSLICGFSGITLAALRDATTPIIEEQVLTYVQAPAIKSVLNEYDNSPIKDRKTCTINGKTLTVFPALRKGALIAVAFETTGRGYGGNIGVMVGFNLERKTLSGIGITTMKETPGLGSRVAGHGYTTQFKEHPTASLELKGNGGDIDAVSGATISSTGTVNAVKEAISTFNALKSQLTHDWS